MTVGQEIEKLTQKHGALSPQVVYDYARRNKSSACHAEYDRLGLWNDKKAAEAARLSFAGVLIRRYKVRITGADMVTRRVRALISPVDGRGSERSYRLRGEIDSMDMRRDAARELRSVSHRYADALTSNQIEVIARLATDVEFGGGYGGELSVAAEES